MRFFENFGQNRFFFQSFDQINSFEKFDKHRDFLKKKIHNRFEIFHKISERSYFSSILRKTHNFQQIQDYKKNDKNR